MKDPALLELNEYFETERTYYRPYKRGDGEAFFNILQQNSDHLRNVMFEVEKIKSVEEAEIRNIDHLASWVGRKRFVLPVFLKETEEMISELWIEPLEKDPVVYEVGYFIIKSKEGMGLVTEVVKSSLDFMFNQLQATKVEIHTDDDNIRSENVAKRLNFKIEGHLRARGRTAGHVVGRLYYGLLKSEYEN